MSEQLFKHRTTAADKAAMGRSIEVEINGEWWAVDESGAWLRLDPETNSWTAVPDGPGRLDDGAVVDPSGAARPPRAPASVHDAVGGPMRSEARAFQEELSAQAQRFVDEPVLACGLFSSAAGLLARGLESSSPIVGRLIGKKLAKSGSWSLVLVAVTWAHVYVFSAEQDENPFSGQMRTTIGSLLESWPRQAVSLRPAERRLGAALLDRVAHSYVVEIAGEGPAVTLESLVHDGGINREVIKLLQGDSR